MSDRAPLNSEQSVSSAPPLVGRGEEMRRLAAALARAANGQGSTVLLAGDPGIGKTRLAREALALASSRGFLTLEGQAHPLEGSLAYAPFLHALGPFLRQTEPTRRARLVAELSDLGRLFADLRLPAPEPLGDPALEKTRLFEAVSRLLERLAEETPVVLFIDDLEWADPASLELLHYVVQGLTDLPVLVLGTYHADAVGTTPGLRTLVRSLERAGLCEELLISRLDDGATAELAHAILDEEPPRELLAMLEARAGGTPLFVQALIAALVDAGDLLRTDQGWLLRPTAGAALPRSVRALILERLERLPPSDRKVVQVIALIGGAAPHAVLLDVAGLGQDQLLGSLQRLHAVGLVAEETIAGAVTYRLAHPLVQEVAYGELPEMTRRSAHVSVAMTLERLHPEDLDGIAQHYLRAGSAADRDQALAVLLAAGERASARYANDEAARYFGAALAALRGGRHVARATGPDGPLLPWLLERLGEAWERLGEAGAAVGVWSEALAERERAGDAFAVARLRRRLAMAEWDRGNFEVAQHHMVDGLAALAGQGPCQELADLHYWRWIIFNRLGDVAGLADTTATLMALAERLGSPTAAAEAHRAACGLHMLRGELAAARECGLRGLRTAEEAGEAVLVHRAHDSVALVAMATGDHQSVRRHTMAGLALARRLGAPAMELTPRQHLFYADFLAGEWDEALRRCAECITLARRVGQRRAEAYALGARALLLACRGELEAAEGCLAEARGAFGSGSPADRPVFSVVEIAEVTLVLARSEVGRAHALAGGFVQGWESEPTNAGLTAAAAPIGLALLSEVQIADGDASGALRTAGQLAALGAADTPYVAALASRAEGLARQALGETELALACLAQAAATFAGLEIPFEAARSRLEWGTIAATAHPTLAAAAARESIAVFERLGARPGAQRARRLLKQLGVPPPAARRQRRSAARLSDREREVARLVAEGLTSAEIAERLTLSPRTVTTHLDHIYARLGIGSRAALARYVVEKGLLSAAEKNT